MAEDGRIERKPEYDAADWEAVGKLKQIVEKRGFSFVEAEDEFFLHGDVSVGWNKGVVSDLRVDKGVPGMAEPLHELQHLKHIKVGGGCQDVRWTGTLRGIQEFVFYDRANQYQWPDKWTSSSTINNLTISYAAFYAPVVPPCIRECIELQFLSLAGHDGSPLVIPDWLGELPKLERLDLSFSHILSIPYSLVQTGMPFVTEIPILLPDDERGIFLHGVTLQEGDISLFSQPREVIEAYYRGKGYGPQEAERECKVIFLGEGNAGKSSLIDRIQEPDKPFELGRPATPGVRVTKWEAQAPDGPVFLRVMDFGGQEIMHSMHRCFLTGHTVYVIVCESRADGNVDNEAKKWVETVNAFAPGCPVILALNKADLNPNMSVNEKDLRQRNPALKKVLKTSAPAAPDDIQYGVNRLADEILKQVPDCMDRFLANADWLGVKRGLLDMVEQDKDYFTADEYRDLCRKHNISDEQDALRFKMLDHFKNLGVSYYYAPEGPDHSLEHIRVLNPAWLTNGIYRLILWTPEGGFLKRSEIRKLLGQKHEKDILEDKTYQGLEVDFVLHVMEEFKISMDIGNGVEMLPMKMVKTPPDSADDFPRADALHLRWEASYLPDNLVHRLMIELFPDLYKGMDGKYCVWRTGARFRWNGCGALAEMRGDGLDVYVHGPRGDTVRAYMEAFRRQIAQILSDLNIKAGEMIYYSMDGFEGKIPYTVVMDQFSQCPDREIYIPPSQSDAGPGQYVHPRELLRGTYPNFEEMVKQYQDSRERDLNFRQKEAEIKKANAEAEKAETETGIQRKMVQWVPIILLAALALILILIIGGAIGGQDVLEFFKDMLALLGKSS